MNGTSNVYKWAWLALAAVALAGWGYASRLTYRNCHANGCIVTNRWTGSVRWRSAAHADVTAPQTVAAAVNLDSLLAADSRSKTDTAPAGRDR